MQLPGVERVNGPMCSWHMTPPEGIKHLVHSGGPVAKGPRTTPVFVNKETGWLTNCPALARALERTCTNEFGNAPWHRHFHLVGGGIDFSARYPPKLVTAVLRAARDQLRLDGHLSALESEIAGPIAEEDEVPPEWRELLTQGGGFWDDVHGGWLPEKLVIAARAEELRWVHEQEVYKIVPRKLAEAKGQKPLSLLWVDTNKS